MEGLEGEKEGGGGEVGHLEVVTSVNAILNRTYLEKCENIFFHQKVFPIVFGNPLFPPIFSP